MNKILVEVSVGELLDKLSILEIKKDKIKDNNKLKFIKEEYVILKNQFEKNIKIKISNKDMKINNILNSTSFNNLQKLELMQGFNESINKNKFFAVGQKDQWKSALEQNQIKIIENKFGLMMQKLKYKLFD